MEKEKIGIGFLDYYIPKNIKDIQSLVDELSDSNIPKSFKNKEEFLMFTEYVLGLESVRIETELNETQLLGKLIENMFESHIIEPGLIDLVVICQEPKPNQSVNLGQFLMHEYQMSNAFSMIWSGNQCCNMEVAVQSIVGMMRNNIRLNNVLLLSSIVSNSSGERIIDTYGIYGDGAGLILLNKDPILTFDDAYLVTENSFHNTTLNSDAVSIHAENIYKCFNGLLERNDDLKENVDQIIVQNANSMLVTQCLASIGVDKTKLFDLNLSKYGHLGCIDFVVNLKDAIENRNNAAVLSQILTFGIGFSGTYISSLYIHDNCI